MCPVGMAHHRIVGDAYFAWSRTKHSAWDQLRSRSFRGHVTFIYCSYIAWGQLSTSFPVLLSFLYTFLHPQFPATPVVILCCLRPSLDSLDSQAFIRLRPSFISLFLGFTLTDIRSRCLLLICWPAWRPFRVLHMREST